MTKPNKSAASLFVTFEGSEAVGKSTIIEQVYQHFYQQGIKVLKTREPGGTSLAEALRDLMFSKEDPDHSISSETELLLMFAARRDHLEKVIIPALDNQYIVLCDRFIDSSYVYQSVLRGVPLRLIDGLVNDFIKPFMPDQCFIIDCPAEVSLTRLETRGSQNRYDQSSLTYLTTLRQAFLDRASQNSDYQYDVIDNKNLSETVRYITNELTQLYRLLK